MTELLSWRNVSTPNLRDFLGYDGDRDVARIYQTANVSNDWTWSVYAIVPARPGLTHGHEADPKEARRKVEAAWAIAKASGDWIPTAAAAHLHVKTWPSNDRDGRS
jgi:hypothetical protein